MNKDKKKYDDVIKKTTVSISMPKEEAIKIKQYAHEQGMSVSELAEKAVIRKLNNLEGGDVYG